MCYEVKHDRRRFLGGAAMAIAAAQFGMLDYANAQSGKINPADLAPITPGAYYHA
jgi:hypothetical protein